MRRLLLVVAYVLGLQSAASATVLSIGQLEAEINAEINTNGRQAITGSILNGVLIDMTQSLNLGSFPANDLIIGGGVGLPPTTTPTGAGVLTALGNAPDTNNGFATWSAITGISSEVAGLVGDEMTDNSPALAAYLASVGNNPQQPLIMNGVAGTARTSYYFSKSFDIKSSGFTLSCQGMGTNNVWLIFAAGVDGVIEDVSSAADIDGCYIASLGTFYVNAATVINGNATITNITPFYAGDDSGPAPYPFFAAGDGVIVKGVDQSDAALATPSGAYIASGNSGTNTIVMASGFAPTSTPLYATMLYRLPAALTQNVTTTIGSPNVNSCGSYTWVSGDLVWSDAFVFGTTVLTASAKIGGCQDLLMNTAYENTGPQNATVAHLANSGKMWLVPAGVKRRNAGKTHNVYTKVFPIGLQMSCSSAGGINCTGSYDSGFTSFWAMVGRWVAGNNTGGSSSHNNFYTTSLRYAVWEGGTLGSYYYGDTYESSEHGNAISDVLINCINQNYSSWYGTYTLSYGNYSVCADSNDPYNVAPAVVTFPGSGGNQPSAIAVFGTTGNAMLGIANYQGAHMSGTPFSFGGYGNCWQFSGGEAPISGELTDTFYTLWSNTCNFRDGILGGYDTTLGYVYSAYNNTSLLIYTDPAVYTKYGNSFFRAMLPAGVLLGNVNSQGSGDERMIDAGGAAQAYTTGLRGDLRVNNVPVAGGTACWSLLTNAGTGTPGCPIALDSGGTTWVFQNVQGPSSAPVIAPFGATLKPVAISALPSCGAPLQGTVTAVNNGTDYATGTYGSAVSATGAVTRGVLCTNTAGPTTYAWAYN